MKIFKCIDETLKRVFLVDYVIHARVLLLLFLCVLTLPIILTQFPISIVDFTETGTIGDTIGGITAPFIGILAGYITFLAFHEQYKFNDESKKDLEKERFESKFYNFLTLLNNLEINTEIPHVGNYKQAFHFMFYEYKAICVLWYRQLGAPTLVTKKEELGIKEDGGGGNAVDIRAKIMKDAFGIFINGVSSSSTSRLNEYIDGSEDKNDYFLKLQKLYQKPENPSVPYLDDYTTVNIKLFDGHRLRLISFFRLVCKIIEMIYNDGGNDKELYLSTLLSLLSEHQIALLKLLYVYDRDEHDRFIMKNKEFIDSFFMNQYDKNSNIDNICISKYIYTDIMDCTKEKFINFEKGNKVGLN